ncbi:MAG TPA: HigA family addiction module antitoxin [Nostocaceae cyanobacterium]|nr:HigA family addiction module antitoxin [Nostocaceae cyanobacterium]
MHQKLTPARVPTPGKILNRELEARGWTQQDLAKIIDISAETIKEIICSTKQITPELAIKFSQAFGTSPEFWINLEFQYQFYLKKM